MSTNFHDIDPSCFISYDKWKKLIKTPTNYFKINWRYHMFQQCDKIEETLFHRKHSSSWFLRSFTHRCNNNRVHPHKVVVDDILLKVCELNKKTLYKICKKIDKILLPTGSKEALRWYEWLCRHNRYNFLGCRQLKRIKLMTSFEECPVCYEEVNDTNGYIPNCGHILCNSCANQIHQTLSLQGLCPMCRQRLVV